METDHLKMRLWDRPDVFDTLLSHIDRERLEAFRQPGRTKATRPFFLQQRQCLDALPTPDELPGPIFHDLSGDTVVVGKTGDLDQAQHIADFERNRRNQPQGFVRSIGLRSHGKKGGGQHAQQLARAIGDLVKVKETQTAHDANYYIIGETHKLTNSATLLETTWSLEPAPDSFPWKLGVVGRSEVGQKTVLTY